MADNNELRLAAIAELNKRGFTYDPQPALEQMNIISSQISQSDAMNELKRRGDWVDSDYSENSIDVLKDEGIKQYTQPTLPETADPVGGQQPQQPGVFSGAVHSIVKSYVKFRNDMNDLTTSDILGELIPGGQALRQALGPHLKQLTKTSKTAKFIEEIPQNLKQLRGLPEQAVEAGITPLSGVLQVIPGGALLNQLLPDNIKKAESSVASINFIQRLPASLLEIGLEMTPLTAEEAMWTTATYGAFKGAGKAATATGKAAQKFIPKTAEFVKKIGKSKIRILPKKASDEGVESFKKALPVTYTKLKSLFKENNPDDLLHIIGNDIKSQYPILSTYSAAEKQTMLTTQAEAYKIAIKGIANDNAVVLNTVYDILQEYVPHVLKQRSFKEAIDYQILSTGSTFMKKQGFWGKQVENTMQKVRVEGEMNAGKKINIMQKALDKLNDADIALFADVVEGRAVAQTPQLKIATAVWNNIAKSTADESAFRGLTIINSEGKRIPWQPRDNYFPRIYSDDALNITGSKRSTIINNMIKSGKAKNTADADTQLKQFLKGRGERRVGNLQKAREFDLPGYEKDPRKVLKDYIIDSQKRIAEAKYFRADDSVAREMISRIGPEGGNVELANEIFDRFMELVPRSGSIAKINETLTGMQLMTKLGLSQITNMGQTTNTAALTGIKNTVKAIRLAFTKEGKEFGLTSGAIFASIMDDIVRSGTAGSKYLKYIGFRAVEKFNRIVAANAGKLWAQDLADDFVQHPNSAYIRRQLKKLLLDPDSILKRNGKLLEDELLQAGNMVSKITQFKTGPLDLPGFFASPNAKVFTQFKSFAINHAKFVQDNIVKEVAKGNMAPMLRFLSVGQVAGEVLADAKAFIRGRKRPSNLLLRAIENYATVGSFGFYSDLWQAAQYGEKGLLSAAVGPSAADAVKVAIGLDQTTKGNLKPLGKISLEQLPLFGAVAFGPAGAVVGSVAKDVSKSRIFPPKKESKFKKRRSNR